MKRIRSLINDYLAIQLFKRLILLHIDYSDIAYITANKKDCQALRVVQKGCHCICPKADPRIAIIELHHKPKLSKCRSSHVCTMAY